MRKINGILTSLLTSVLLVSVVTHSVKAEQIKPSNQSQSSYPEKHLLLNDDGSYGGSLNKTVYGEGTPKNGELDHPESGYWKINDYYNATTTTTRTLIHNFAPYQQTMKDDSGIACALMVMNHYGFTDRRIYSEERLVKRYESLNNTTVYNHGTTAEGLTKLFNSFGLFAKPNCFDEERSTQGVATFIKKNLENNAIVLLPFWSDGGYQWYTCIGVDGIVAIMADPFDVYDHYQDGYRTFSIDNIYNYMLNIDEDVKLNSDKTDDSYSYRKECVVIKAPVDYPLDLTIGEETLQPTIVTAENHLLPDLNGLYNGKMLGDDGVSTPWGGSDHWDNWDNCSACVKNQVYFTANDYYNYDDEGSRVFLNHYRAKQQTTASTCGICSTLSALVYYGVPYDESNRDLNDYTVTSEYKLMKQCESLNNITIYNRGVANYEIDKLIKKWGFSTVHSAGYNMTNYLKGTASKVYPTYQKFHDTLKQDLSANHPFLVGWRVGGGHWQVIFGFDDMGTASPYDDVCVFADSSDRHDLWKDGYDVYSGMWALNHWYNGAFHWNQQGIVFKK